MSIENKAFGYIRVSTGKQKAGETYMYQEKAIRDYAEQNGLELVDTFNDKGVSGIETDREHFDKMMARIDEVRNIVFFDWSRISRNMLYSSYLLYEFKNLGIVLHNVSHNEILNIDNDTSLLMQQIQAFVSSQERLQTKVRQKAAIKNYIAEHGYWGQKKHVFTSKEMKQYKEYREMGLSKVKIARLMKVSKSILYRNIKEFELEDKLRELKINKKNSE